MGLRRRKFLEENTDPAKAGDGGEHTPIRSRSNSMMSRQSFQHRSSARSSRSNSTLGDLGGFKAQSQQLERSGIPSVPLQPGDGTAAAASLEFSSGDLKLATGSAEDVKLRGEGREPKNRELPTGIMEVGASPDEDPMEDSNRRMFAEGMETLREEWVEHPEITEVAGKESAVFYTCRSRQAMYEALIDEISYFMLVQRPPPPIFCCIFGDLPAPEGPDCLPWPSMMRDVNVHVVGSVKALNAYRSISPAMSVLDWSSWLEHFADDHIGPEMSRHLGVPCK